MLGPLEINKHSRRGTDKTKFTPGHKEAIGNKMGDIVARLQIQAKGPVIVCRPASGSCQFYLEKYVSIPLDLRFQDFVIVTIIIGIRGITTGPADNFGTNVVFTG